MSKKKEIRRSPLPRNYAPKKTTTHSIPYYDPENNTLTFRCDQEAYDHLVWFLKEDGNTVQNFLFRSVMNYCIKKENEDNAYKSYNAQKEYCELHNIIQFAPFVCPYCGENVFGSAGDSHGYSTYYAAHRQITACPHCHSSFVD